MDTGSSDLKKNQKYFYDRYRSYFSQQYLECEA